MNENPHRRFNALRGSWILVSPQRDQRPWQGLEEPLPAAASAYDPDCYLCPGNARAGGQRNPDYDSVYVFDNDFPALLPETVLDAADDPLLRREPVEGRCRVICYSPRHDLRLADMSEAEVTVVVEHWAREVRELQVDYEHIQVFENRGDIVGCSNPHPHGQIWAQSSVPTEVDLEDQEQRSYRARYGSRLLLDYARREIDAGERCVVMNDDWLVVVPWWAGWPFETLVLPLVPVDHLPSLTARQHRSLAGILGQLLRAYDRLFDAPFPYSMGWHGAPTSCFEDHWQLHAHFYPPLLRSATVRKHMVGYEMLGEPQRDLTPETAARRLREVCE